MENCRNLLWMGRRCKCRWNSLRQGRRTIFLCTRFIQPELIRITAFWHMYWQRRPAFARLAPQILDSVEGIHFQAASRRRLRLLFTLTQPLRQFDKAHGLQRTLNVPPPKQTGVIGNGGSVCAPKHGVETK